MPILKKTVCQAEGTSIESFFCFTIGLASVWRDTETEVADNVVGDMENLVGHGKDSVLFCM